MHTTERPPAGVEADVCGYEFSVGDLESSTETTIELLPFFLSNVDILLKPQKYVLIPFAVIYFCPGKGIIFNKLCILCLQVLRAMPVCGIQFIIFSSYFPPPSNIKEKGQEIDGIELIHWILLSNKLSHIGLIIDQIALIHKLKFIF